MGYLILIPFVFHMRRKRLFDASDALSTQSAQSGDRAERNQSGGDDSKKNILVSRLVTQYLSKTL